MYECVNGIYPPTDIHLIPILMPDDSLFTLYIFTFCLSQLVYIIPLFEWHKSIPFSSVHSYFFISASTLSVMKSMSSDYFSILFPIVIEPENVQIILRNILWKILTLLSLSYAVITLKKVSSTCQLCIFFSTYQKDSLPW